MTDSPYTTHLKEQAHNPQWERATKVHDWRNHVPDEIRNIWSTFTPEQREALVMYWAEESANAEHWD